MMSGSQIRARAGHEFKEFAWLALYLWITFGAVVLLKAAVLRAHGIVYLPFGFAALKALICAKFILVGRMAGVAKARAGERLIVSIGRKSFALLVVLVALTVVEEVVVALIHGRSVTAALAELGGGTHLQLAATVFVLLLILIPYVAFHALDEVLGKGELRRLLLERQRKE